MADEAREPLDFSGRVVVVTGGTRGVGRGVAEMFLGAGAHVVVCARHAPDAPPGRDGAVASFVAADVRRHEEAAAVIGAAVERHGRLDVLVNNAGGSPSVAAADMSPNFLTSVVSLNLFGPFFCAQAANAVMQGQAEGGCILNISSVSALRPSPGAAGYAAAKAGLLSLTRTLAVEWAPKVRVNCVVAGLLRTDTGAEHYGGEEGMRAVAATVPLGRLGTARDVGGVCLFLASPLAGYVSGAAVEAHGGGERPAYLTALGE